MIIYVKTQAELDAIPLDTKDFVCIDFGTKEKPAIVRGQYCYPVRVMNNNVVATYSNSEVCAWDDSQVAAHDNSQVWSHDNSKVCAYGNSNICAYDNSKIWAHDNSIICVWYDSQVAAYDNSKVWAYKDENIVSINGNAIVISPSIFCSGAELLNQCNGNIGNVKFAVSNVVPDEDKDYVFRNFCHTDDFSKRAFVLTMRGVPYYCVYNFDTSSVKFYKMNFQQAFKNITENTVLIYYLDNVLMPALVNAKFDKSAKSNII